MVIIKDEIEKKFIDIGIALNNIESLLRIMQACLEDEENLKSWDIETIFEIIKLKTTETKNKFNDIEVVFKI